MDDPDEKGPPVIAMNTDKQCNVVIPPVNIAFSTLEGASGIEMEIAENSASSESSNGEGFQTVESRKKKRKNRSGVTVGDGSRVSVLGSNIGMINASAENSNRSMSGNVVIVKPTGANSESFLVGTRARQNALDSSLFKKAGILRATTNRFKGHVVIEIMDNRTIMDLCKIQKLGEWEVKCNLPYAKRVHCGVLQGVHPLIPEDEISESLTNAGFPFEKLTRIHRTTSEGRVKTHSVKVDFLIPLDELPREILVNYNPCRLRPYEHNPVRCFKCQKFGHVSSQCKTQGKNTCSKCAGDHLVHECTQGVENYKCANCEGPHPSYSKYCPKFLEKKAVDDTARHHGVSYAEALKLVNEGKEQQTATSQAGSSIQNSNTTLGTDNSVRLKAPQEISYPRLPEHIPKVDISVGTPPKMVDMGTQTEVNMGTQTEAEDIEEIETPMDETLQLPQNVRADTKKETLKESLMKEIKVFLMSEEYTKHLIEIMTNIQSKTPKISIEQLVGVSRQNKRKTSLVKRKTPENHADIYKKGKKTKPAL